MFSLKLVEPVVFEPSNSDLLKVANGFKGFWEGNRGMSWLVVKSGMFGGCAFVVRWDIFLADGFSVTAMSYSSCESISKIHVVFTCKHLLFCYQLYPNRGLTCISRFPTRLVF